MPSRTRGTRKSCVASPRSKRAGRTCPRARNSGGQCMPELETASADGTDTRKRHRRGFWSRRMVRARMSRPRRRFLRGTRSRTRSSPGFHRSPGAMPGQGWIERSPTGDPPAIRVRCRRGGACVRVGRDRGCTMRENPATGASASRADSPCVRLFAGAPACDRSRCGRPRPVAGRPAPTKAHRLSGEGPIAPARSSARAIDRGGSPARRLLQRHIMPALRRSLVQPERKLSTISEKTSPIVYSSVPALSARRVALA